MSSPSDWRYHKAGTSGSSNKGDQKSNSFDNVLLDYEKFVSGERIGCRGDEAIMAHQREVPKSSTSIRTEVRSDQRESAEVASSGDCGGSEEVVPRVEEGDDSSLAAYGGLETKTGSSPFPSSVITRKSLVELVHTFHLPQGYKVLIPRVVISSHYLFVGLRFLLSWFLISVLNLLKLVPMQLTTNAYARLLSFYLILRRKMIGSSTDNILRHCFQMKKCSKKSLSAAGLTRYIISLHGQMTTGHYYSRTLSPTWGSTKRPTFNYGP
ncbi:hypothetical protein ACOSQ2_010357 [Xanthoceras sorbifolium]